MRNISTSPVAMLMASTMLAPVAALAQDQGLDETYYLGEIVISTITDGGENATNVEAVNTAGSRVPINPQELPRSVTTLPKELFEAQGARNLEEAVAYSPGISTGTYGQDDRYDEFILRGFESQSSGIYRDGMPQRLVDFAAWRTETFGVDSVNILRGPTSDLYGANQPGGLLNVVSKRPQFTFQGEAIATTRSHGGLEMGVDVTGPLSDTVAYRFIALGNKFGTKYDAVDTGRVYIAPSLTYAPTDQTTFTVFGQYMKDDVGDVYINVPEYGSLEPNGNGQWPTDLYTANPDYNDIETKQSYLGYELEHEFDNQLSFVSRARYAQNEWNMRTNYAASFVNLSYLLGAPVGLPSDVDTGVMSLLDVDQEVDSFNADNALHYKFESDRVSGQVAFGVDYFKMDSDYKSVSGYAGERNYVTGAVTNFLAGAFPTSLPTERKTELDQVGLYASGHASIGDKWIINGGLRMDWVNYGANGFLTNLDTSVTSYNHDMKDTLPSANLSVGYNLSQSTMVYGSLSNSFNLPLSGIKANGDALDVEKAVAGELGLKYTAPSGQTTFNAALFNIQKNDVVFDDPASNSPIVYTQVGKVRSQGLELEVTHDFGNGLSLFGSATYTDAEITEDATYGGNKVARVPDIAAALFAEYQLPQVAGLTIGAGARYTGSRYADVSNTYDMKSVMLFDASIRYDWNDWQFMLAARNLADKEYVGYCHGNALTGNAVLDSVSGGCVYGEGREFTLTARKFF